MTANKKAAAAKTRRRGGKDATAGPETTGEWLANLVEAIPDAVYFKDLKGRHLLVNRAFAEISGRPAEECRGRTDHELLPPRLARQCRQGDRKVLASGKSVQTEETFFDADGRERRFSTIKNVVRDRRGKKIGLVGVSREITAYTEMVGKLAESRGRYRALVENSLMAIMIISAERRLLFANTVFYRLAGWKPDDLAGRDVFTVIHPDDRDEALKVFGRKIKSPPDRTKYRCRLLRPDGAVIWIEGMSAPIDYRGEKALMVNFADISRRSELEERLKESLRFLETLMDNLPGMVYRCKNDRNWTMEYVSRGCRELTGYRPDELIGNRVIAYNDLICPEDRERVWEKWQEHLRRREPFQDTYRIIAADGAVKWVWERGEGVFNERGELTGLEGFITDISERKAAERRLRETSRLEALGTLALVISHEFNNILMGISGYAQIARQAPRDEALVVKSLEVISRQSSRAAELVARIGRFGRRRESRPEAVDLSRVLDEVVAFQKGELKMSRIKVRTEYRKPLVVRADPAQMEQLFLNLLINARQAVTPGRGEIVIRATSGKKTVTVKVIDNGRGIAADELPRVFMPFFSTENVRKDEKTDRLGLGLWVSRQIVKGHEGEIAVESAPGKGATFTVRLPRATGEAVGEKKPPPKTRRERTPPGSRILVVDDEDQLLDVICGYLEKKGFKVSAAGNGGEALKLCRRHRFRAILLDYLMPGICGIELIRKLRKTAPGSAIFVVSGHKPPPEDRREIASLVTDWLVKPIELKKLDERIRGLPSRNAPKRGKPAR